MNWLDELKIALLEKDLVKAFEMSTHLPSEGFDQLDDMLQAQELITQTIYLLKQEKEKIRIAMQQIRIAQKFLQD